MKALIRRTLLVSGMIVGAYATGNFLGNFTVAGLKEFNGAMNGVAALDPMIDNATSTLTEQAAAATPSDQFTGNHVCQGCDAKLHPEPDFADYSYEDAPLSTDHYGRDETLEAPQALMAVAPPRPASPPAAPALPVLRNPGAPADDDPPPRPE